MALRYCPHCAQKVTARRQFGIGTLLLVLVTGGLWLLVLGCYLPRCPLCKSHFLGKDTAPDAPGGRRRPVPPAPTDYEGRLDALVHTLPVGHIFCFRGIGAMMGIDSPS